MSREGAVPGNRRAIGEREIRKTQVRISVGLPEQTDRAVEALRELGGSRAR